MQIFLRFILLFMLLWIDRVLLSGWAWTGMLPDFPLILLMYWLPPFSRHRAVALGFIIGLLQDLAAPGVAGLNAISKSIGCYLAASLPKGRFPQARLWMPVALLVSGSVQLLLHTLYFQHVWAAGMLNPLLRYGFPRFLSTVVAGTVLAWFLDWLHERKTGE